MFLSCTLKTGSLITLPLDLVLPTLVLEVAKVLTFRFGFLLLILFLLPEEWFQKAGVAMPFPHPAPACGPSPPRGKPSQVLQQVHSICPFPHTQV